MPLINLICLCECQHTHKKRDSFQKKESGRTVNESELNTAFSLIKTFGSTSKHNGSHSRIKNKCSCCEPVLFSYYCYGEKNGKQN